MDEETRALAKNFPPYLGDQPVLVERMPSEKSGEPGVPAFLEERRGRQVWIRAKRDGDPEDAVQIVVHPGDVVIPFIPVPWLSLHTSSTPGDGSGFLVGVPLMEISRDDVSKVVYARTCRTIEPMPKVGPRWPHGYDFQLPAGEVAIELDYVDQQTPKDVDGYQPLTDALWTWMSIGKVQGDDILVRYLLAAARKLDGAHRALRRAEVCLSAMGVETPGPILRGKIFEYLAEIEGCIISLNRVLAMASRISEVADVTIPLPSEVARLTPMLKEFRDAYEHIDERARGLVKTKPNPYAVSIFEWAPLLQGSLSYNGVVIQIEEVEASMVEMRAFLKTVASQGLEALARLTRTFPETGRSA